MACMQCVNMSAAPLTARRAAFRSAVPQQIAPQRLMARSRQQRRKPACQPVAALNIDWSDPDTLIGETHMSDMCQKLCCAVLPRAAPQHVSVKSADP